jgi:hypothetical protein
LTTANEKSSDKAAIEAVLVTVNAALDTTDNGATQDQVNALTAVKNNATNLLDKIRDIAAAIADVNTKTDGITIDNAKSSDKANLESALSTANDLLTNKAGNLTDTEKSELEQKKTEVIIQLDKINKEANKSLLEDLKTGIQVEGVNGKIFDSRTELVVTPVKDTLAPQTKALYVSGISKVANGQELAQLYDIKLLLNGQPVQPDGKVKITLTLNREMEIYTDLHVVYIADDGTTTIIPFTQNGNKVTFITDHFSNYGIIGTPKEQSNPRMGDNSLIVPLGVLGTIALIIVIFPVVLMKKRKYWIEKCNSNLIPH